jgi:hypothetical protein
MVEYGFAEELISFALVRGGCSQNQAGPLNAEGMFSAGSSPRLCASGANRVLKSKTPSPDARKKLKVNLGKLSVFDTPGGPRKIIPKIHQNIGQTQKKRTKKPCGFAPKTIQILTSFHQHNKINKSQRFCVPLAASKTANASEKDPIRLTFLTLCRPEYNLLSPIPAYYKVLAQKNS